MQEDGSLKEVEGYRRCTVESDTRWAGPGTVYPTVDDWVSAMELEARQRRPWYDGLESWKFSYCPEDTYKCSSVVWAPHMKHYKELRRDKCHDTERRTWATVREWVEQGCGWGKFRATAPKVKNCGHKCLLHTTDSCCACMDLRPVKQFYERYVDGIGIVADRNRWDDYCPHCSTQHNTKKQQKIPVVTVLRRSPRIAAAAAAAAATADAVPVVEAPAAEAVPIVEAPVVETPVVETPVVEIAAVKEETPVAVPVEPFDAEKLMEDFNVMSDWFHVQKGLHLVAGIVQVCKWLRRTATKGSPARAWIKENPTWRYSARALIQAYGLKANHPLSTKAVNEFLEKF